MRRFMIGLAWCLLVPVVQAHGGGLNAEGCHTNRKTGDYHCHGAPRIDRSENQRPSTPPTETRSRFVPDTQDRARSPQGGEGPTCYVGPRGGTYTITRSGRKNYSGC